MTLTQLFTNIANAIRSKKGTSGTIIAENFPQEISSIETPNLQNKQVSITQNGTTTVTPDSGYNGLSGVEIDTNVVIDRNAKILQPTTISSGVIRCLQIIDEFDITNISSLSSCFSDCERLISIPTLDCINITNMSYTFNYCKSIKSINLQNTNNVTNMSYAFKNCESLEAISLNTNNVTNMSAMFNNCIKITSINLTSTANVTNMSSMFSQCYSLKDIPLLNTSKVTDFYNFVRETPRLTDTSLDNILQMCINATSYTGIKTLERLGFDATNYPVSRIQALPHYQDFIDANWTIGY